MSMKTHLWIICAALLTFNPLMEAAYKMGINQPLPAKGKHASSTGKSGKSTGPAAGREAFDDEQPVLQNLSEKFDISVERLRYLRGIHNGYEEIVPALIVAREAKVEVGRILKDRMNGKAWKFIAHLYLVDLKPLNEEVIDLLKPIRKRVSKEAMAERPTARQSSK